MTYPPRDYPASDDADYQRKVDAPLAAGRGVLAFQVKDTDPAYLGFVSVHYEPGLAEAIDPDGRTRMRELLRAQHSAREIVRTMGLEAVVM